MQDFGEKDLELIKTLQQIIIKNTAVLYNDTRSKVYSKFQSIGYSYIDSEEAQKLGAGVFSIAFYSSNTNKIYIIKEKNKTLAPNVLLHEMIHSISDAQEWNLDKEKGYLYKSGIIENITYVKEKNLIPYSINKNNVGINEGFTEFLTSKFLDYESGSYSFEVHITKFISDAIGFENLMQCYFNNNANQLKKLIRTAFYLPNDYLIDKLFLQLDILCNYSKTGCDRYNSIPIIKSCYETLIKMNLVKTQYINNNYIKDEKDTFKFFDIRKYLHTHEIKNLGSKFDDMLIDDLVNNRYSLLNGLDDSSGYKDIGSMTSYVVEQLYNNKFDEVSYIIRSGKSCLKVLQTLNTITDYGTIIDNQIKLIDKSIIINKFLSCLAGKDKKIDFQYFTETEKNEFILNSLYSPYNKDKENCKYFGAVDLVDFVNSGATEYKHFLNDKTFEYIKPCFKHINADLYFKKDFFNYAFKNMNSKSLNDNEDLM